jgi:hypothetical protein
MKKYTFLICCLLFVGSAYAQQDITKKWLVQTDTAYHFSFKYPNDWTLKLPGTNVRFFVTSVLENDEDKFKENMNCSARVLEQKGFKISTAKEALKQSLEEKLSNFILLKTNYIQWNNAETLVMEYTCTQTSNDITYNIHILQKMAVVKNTLYTFTYTAEEASYKKFIPIANAVFTSLKVK